MLSQYSSHVNVLHAGKSSQLSCSSGAHTGPHSQWQPPRYSSSMRLLLLILYHSSAPTVHSHCHYNLLLTLNDHLPLTCFHCSPAFTTHLSSPCTYVHHSIASATYIATLLRSRCFSGPYHQHRRDQAGCSVNMKLLPASYCNIMFKSPAGM